jgi:nicotinamide-nucleotide amidase
MVTYSNQAKTRQLGVPLELLEAHGAVSPEVARAMAQGARAQANADLGLGITGIAGPGGGSPEKPVGLVYLTLAGPGPDDLLELERRYPGTRTLVQTRATAGALGLLVRSLAGGG